MPYWLAPDHIIDRAKRFHADQHVLSGEVLRPVMGDAPTGDRYDPLSLGQLQQVSVYANLPREKTTLDLDKHVLTPIEADEPIEIGLRHSVIGPDQEAIERTRIATG